MDLIIAFIFFVFGIVVGSFLNVVIFRFNTSKSFGGRSKCLHCGKKLNWYELFPLISFLFLKGRCRSCRVKISPQYPVVELLSGVIFLGTFLKLQDIFFLDTISFTVSYAFYVVILSILLIIAVYDLKHKVIPDIFSFIFGLLSFIGLFLFSDYLFYPHLPSFFNILSGFFLSIPFALLWFFSKGKWMGLGDAKLILGIGWFLPFFDALTSVIISFWIGAIFGLMLMIFSKKHGIKSEVPFAPFLVLGVALVFLLGFTLFPAVISY